MTTLHPGVSDHTVTQSEWAWQPQMYDPNDPEDTHQLGRLRDSDRVWKSVDTLAQQVRDLAETRLRKASSADVIGACEREITGDRPLDQYGRWVWYPWSGQLVHLLPPKEFRELRLDRNRHKVTDAEQVMLDRLTVGIVGLSVGNAIATTLALEGTCRQFKLADFDQLSLSNLNRLRAGVEGIGIPKTVLAARQIFEIDPYVSLSLVGSGLTPTTIDEFLTGPPAVDILIDECDDLRLKVYLREAARSRRIPVLMATSDRGMMDVERFDLEPTRPLFHGLVGNLAAGDISEHPIMEERVKIVTAILGLDTLSTRIGASMLEIGETITTWPQLASDVALGGAAMTTAVRRLALGQPLPSGRRYLDLDLALTTDLPAKVHDPVKTTPTVAGGVDNQIPELVQFVVAQGILAPSGGNCQPWSFTWDGDHLWIVHDRTRSANLLDVGHRASLVAIGAAIENLRIAAAHRGYETHVASLPCRHNPTVVAALSFTSDETSANSRLAQWFPVIAHRTTNRRLGTGTPLNPAAMVALHEAVRGFGVQLDLRTDAYSLAEAGKIAGAADRIRFFHPDLHAELVAELRWSAETAAATGDGIDLATLELSAAETAAMRLVARPDVAAFLRDLHTGGRAVEAMAEKAMCSSSAVALLTANGDAPADLLQGGQAIERFWLAATEQGISFQPWTTATYLVDLLQTEQVARFTPVEREAVGGIATRLDRLFPCSTARPRLMLARLFTADPPSTRSLRRPLSAVLRSGHPTDANNDQEETR